MSNLHERNALPNANAPVPEVAAGPPAPPPVNPPPFPEPRDRQDHAARPNDAAAPHPAVNRNPRREYESRVPKALASTPALLLAVSNQPLYTVQQQETTQIVPCAVELYSILYEMDSAMSTTNKFISSAPQWNPFVSQLYVGFLFYYQTLKSQRLAGSISIYQANVLQMIDNIYEPDILPIPGPLVPIFQSLAATSGPTTRFGNITFYIPDDLNVSQNSRYLPRDNLGVLLPHLILILDQLCRFFGNNMPGNAAAIDSWYLNIFGQPAQNNADARGLMLTPNARNEIPITLTQMQSCYAARATWLRTLPMNQPRNGSIYTIGNNNDNLTLPQILGIAGPQQVQYNWFPKVSSIMQTYCAFFRSSVSLSAISPIGLGAVLVETAFLDTPNTDSANFLPNPNTRNVAGDANNVLRYSNFQCFNIDVEIAHRDESLEALPEQYGSVSQLNTYWEELDDNVPNGLHIGMPQRMHIADGPLNTLPIARCLGHLTINPSIANIVSRRYHLLTPQQFDANPV